MLCSAPGGAAHSPHRQLESQPLCPFSQALVLRAEVVADPALQVVVVGAGVEQI